MQLNRRQFVASGVAAAAHPALAAKSSYGAKPRTGPSMSDLARVTALPVLKRDRFNTPVIIPSGIKSRRIRTPTAISLMIVR